MCFDGAVMSQHDLNATQSKNGSRGQKLMLKLRLFDHDLCDIKCPLTVINVNEYKFLKIEKACEINITLPMFSLKFEKLITN